MAPRASINLKAAAAALTEYWSPRVVSQVNDQYVKVARGKGELVWHQHEHEDELFIILEGELILAFEDGEVVLQAGDSYLVPRGTMHQPRCDGECLLALVEPVTTLHTGDVNVDATKPIESQLEGYDQ